MQVSLITDQLKLGNFIKQGFFYENVFPDLIFLHSDFEQVDIETIKAKYKLIIIYSNQFELINRVVKSIDLVNSKNIVLVMTDMFEVENKVTKELSCSALKIYSKPFHFREIAGKIRSLLYNLNETGKMSVMEFRDVCLNLETREVKIRDKALNLRNKEFALLQFMIANKGKLLTRMMILEHVWDSNANLFTNTVDVHVSKLRKILKSEDGKDCYIQTIPCSGYILE